MNASGDVVGTMIHGLFENTALVASLLGWLRARRGLPAPFGATPVPSRQAEYDRLESAVRENIDEKLLWRLARLEIPV